MGRFIEDRFEAELVVEQPREEVWRSLERESDGQPLWLLAWPRFPGFETTARVIEVEAPRRVRAVKESEPCKGTEIAVMLEAVESGTKVLVVQSGFPAFVKDALESFEIGGSQIVADLALYLERGVTLSRHSRPWAFAGFTTREVAGGLEVVAAMPGSFGDRVGLEPGDLLVSLGGAPVFTQIGLQAMLRVFPSGQDLEAEWVRGREVQNRTAVL